MPGLWSRKEALDRIGERGIRLTVERMCTMTMTGCGAREQEHAWRD